MGKKVYLRNCSKVYLRDWVIWCIWRNCCKVSLRNCEFGELGKKVYLRNCSKVYLEEL